MNDRFLTSLMLVGLGISNCLYGAAPRLTAAQQLALDINAAINAVLVKRPVWAIFLEIGGDRFRDAVSDTYLAGLHGEGHRPLVGDELDGATFEQPLRDLHKSVYDLACKKRAEALTIARPVTTLSGGYAAVLWRWFNSK